MATLSDDDRCLVRNVVLEALALLSSQDRLTERLDRTIIQRSQDLDESNDERILPDNLRSALVEMAPLLDRPDPNAERWTRRCYADGTSVEGTLQDQPDDQVAEARQLIAELQLILRAPATSSTEIERRDDWSDGPASVSRLVQCGLISARPSWKRVKEYLIAIDNEFTPAGRLADAEKGIIAFAKMVRQKWPILGPGLAIAHVAGFFSGAESAAGRLAAGLSAVEYWLSGQFPAAAKRETWIFEILKPLGEQIDLKRNTSSAVTSDNVAVLLDLIIQPPSSSLTGFQATLNQLTEQLDSKLLFETIQKSQFVAWSELLDMLAPRAGRQTKPRPAQLAAQIVCQTADVLPGKIFKPRLQDMTIGDWSQIFYLSTVPESRTTDTILEDQLLTCPVWAGLLALKRLGFKDQFTSEIQYVLKDKLDLENVVWSRLRTRFATGSDFQNPVAVLSELFGNSRPSSDARIGFSLIIAHPQRFPGGIAALHPTKKHPAICLPEEDALALTRSLRKTSSRFRLNALVFEEPSRDFDPSRIMKEFGAALGGDTPVVGVFNKPPSDSNFSWLSHTPQKSLDELFDRIDIADSGDRQ
tara:strand:- start:34255 stop:36012 length:1758 start_codon:yes stop_codon:yes gene_type:complete